MLARVLVVLTAVWLAACGGDQPRQLSLYPESTQVRLFANADGFQIPDGVSLDQMFDRESGALLNADQKATVTDAVTVLPPGPVSSCAHTWRHVFVFYDEANEPSGALVYCAECGAVYVVGPADPEVDTDQLSFDGEGLNRIIADHDMTIEVSYDE